MHKRVIGGKTYEQHVECAKAAGISLGRYAQEHGLQVGSMYTASRRLRAKTHTFSIKPQPSTSPAVRSNAVMSANAFVPVGVTPTAFAMRARLPNGVELEFSGIDASSWAGVVQALSSLPCSR